MAGNSTIGALKVSLGLDSGQFENGLKRASGALGGLGKLAGNAGVVVGAAMAAATAGYASAVRGAINAADEMGKTAQKVGLTVEGLSRLNYAASLSDLTLDQLSTGLKKLSVNMAEAASTGNGPAAAAFRALGISVTDATGNLKASDSVFSELADKFAGMQDGAGKTALAIDLFGKSGADMIPLLNGGAQAIAAATAEADALGITLSEKTAKQAEIFNDNLTRLKAAGTGVAQQMTAGLLPSLSAVSDALAGAAKNQEFMAGAARSLDVAVKTVAASMAVIGVRSALGFSAALVAQATAAARAAVGMSTLTLATRAFLGPVGLTVAAIGLVAAGFDLASRRGRELDESARAAAIGMDEYEQAAIDAATATGETAVKARELAAALREKRLEDIRGAYAIRDKTVALYEQLVANESLARQLTRGQGGEGGLDPVTTTLAGATSRYQRDLDAAKQNIQNLETRLAAADAAAKRAATSGSALAGAYRAAGAQASAAGEEFERVNLDLINAMDALQKKREALMQQPAPLIDLAGVQAVTLPRIELGSFDGLIERLEQARQAAEDMRWQIDDIFYGLKDNNWTLAASGIVRAMQSVKAAFSAAGTAADKFSAIANIGQALGGAIGGKAGGALSGAASGALAGFATPLGPVGAVIGGALGLFGGLFGSSKAKKAEKAAAAKAAAEEAAAKAAAEAARLQAIANERRALEIQIMRATGDELGALNAEREDALAASDDSNDELLKNLWALTDASDALAKATGLATERRLLEIELMRATGNETAALAAERATELEGLDASLRGLKQQIFAAEDFAVSQASAADAVSAARDQLSAAYEREADALRSTIDRFAQFRDSLAAFRQSLNEGSGAGGGYEAISAAFRNTASLARLGNEQALGDLQGVSERFLAVSRAGAKTQLDYLRDLGAVKAAVSAGAQTAGRQVSVAERQLGELTNTVSGLLAVDTSVKGVSASIEALNVALLAQIQDQNARIEAAASVANTAAGDAQSLGAEVVALRQSLEAGLAAVAINTGQTTKVLVGWDFDGQPEVRDYGT